MVLSAFSVQDQVEKYGAYVGIAAFFGLAVLTLLYFSQARELKRLREWAGRAPERARELEQRVVTQATAAVSRRPAATPLPQRPAPPRRLAEMPAPAAATGAAQAAPGGQATELAEAVPADPATNGNLPLGPGGSVPVGPPAPANGTVPPVADAPARDGDEQPEQPAPAEPSTDAPAAAVPAAAAEAPVDAAPRAADVAAPVDDAPAGAETPAPEDTGEDAAAPVPRATPAQRPAPPRPAPMPLRQSQPSAAAGRPAARRPGQPVGRRPVKPPREGRSAGTIALFVGIAVLVLGGGAFGLSQWLGGDDTPPKPNQPAQPATQTPDATEDGSGSQGTTTTPAAETNVAVLNGTTFNGLAGQIQDRIAAQGFQRGTKQTNPDQSVQASTVYYADGFRTQARRVARLIDVTAVKPLDATTQAQAPQADVVVLAGADKAP
jgi:hypothetical protein